MSTAQASGVRWDLSPLFASPEAAQAAVEPNLDRARTFEREWRGRIATLQPAQLADALRQLGEIDNEISRIASYAMLRKSVDVTARRTVTSVPPSTPGDGAAPKRRPLLRAGVAGAGRGPRCRSWPTRPRSRPTATTCCRSAATAPTCCPSRRSACWPSATRPRCQRLADAVRQTTSHHRGAVRRGRGRAAAHHRPAAGLRPRLPTRRPAGARWRRSTTALEPPAPVLAHCYDSLVADRLVIDRLRSYGDDPMALTHLRNELDGDVVRRDDGRRRGALSASRSAGSGRRPGCSASTCSSWPTSTRPWATPAAVAYDEAARSCDSAFAGFSPRRAARSPTPSSPSSGSMPSRARQARRRVLRPGRPGRRTRT